MKAREKREQEIAFNKNEDLITRMMKILENRGYTDTDWRSENTFEDDVRPLFENMINKEQEKKYCKDCIPRGFELDRCAGCGKELF